MRKLLYLVCVYSNFCYGCNISSDSTPVKYRYQSIVKPEIYKNHLNVLADSIRYLISQKDGPYYAKEDDSLTVIVIDTILYSPKKDKIAFFVITKNSNDKLLSKGKSTEYHYNAHAFTAYNEGNRISRINWISEFNLINYESLEDASERIRETYFTEFKGRLNNEGVSMFKYNLDDIRFWDGPLWE